MNPWDKILPPELDPLRQPTGMDEILQLQRDAQAPVDYAAPGSGLMFADGGGGGGTTINIGGDQSSTTQGSSRKVRSKETAAFEQQVANPQRERLQETRRALAETEGAIQTEIAKDAQAAAEAQMATATAQAKGFADAEADFQKAKAEAATQVKQAVADETKALKERNKSPWANQSTAFKLISILGGASNSYNSYVLGLDPNQTPFARSIREVLDQDQKTRENAYLASREHRELLQKSGPEAAQKEFDRKIAYWKAQQAAGLDKATASANLAKAKAEAGKTVMVPAIGPDGGYALGPDGKPVLESVPIAVARERVKDVEKARLENEAAQKLLGDYDSTSTFSQKTVEAAPEGELSNKPMGADEGKNYVYSKTIAEGLANVKGKTLNDATMKQILYNLRAGAKAGGFVHEWAKVAGLSPVPNSLLSGLSGEQKEIARNWLNISNSRMRFESQGAINPDEYASDLARNLPGAGDSPEQQARIWQSNANFGRSIIPRKTAAKDAFDAYDALSAGTEQSPAPVRPVDRATIEELRAARKAILDGNYEGPGKDEVAKKPAAAIRAIDEALAEKGAAP